MRQKLGHSPSSEFNRDFGCRVSASARHPQRQSFCGWETGTMTLQHRADDGVCD